MKQSVWCLVIATVLSIASVVRAECMGRIPRYVEMRVESCASAAPLARAAIAGKGYSERQEKEVERSSSSLFRIRARQLADVDILEWYSGGSIYRFRGEPRPINGDVARDYLVSWYGGCDELLKAGAHIFDVDVEPPCRDVRVVIDGREMKETNARLLLGLPEAAYLPDQESLAPLIDAEKRLRAALETPGHG